MTATQIGDYIVLQKLGEGAFCQAFGAEKAGSSREYVAKRIKPGLTSIPKIVERIRAQAISPPKVDHPLLAGLVTIVMEGDQYWLVREAARGEPLDIHLKRGGSRGLATVLPPFCDLLDAFAAGHRHGFVHGNLKPSNVWIEPAGRYRVTDFEILRLFGVSAQTRDLLGAAEYRAPEHSSGEDLDARSDVYSLGIILQHILTGKLPVRQGARGVPADISAVLERATAAEKEDRYRSAAEFREALLKCVPASAPIPDVVVLPPAAPPVELAAGDPHRSRLFWAAAGLAAAMALGWVVWRTSDSEKTASAKSIAAAPQAAAPAPTLLRTQAPQPVAGTQTGKAAPRGAEKAATPAPPQQPPAAQADQKQPQQQPRQFVWNQTVTGPRSAGAPVLPAGDPVVPTALHAAAPPPVPAPDVRVLPPPPAAEAQPAPQQSGQAKQRISGKAVGARLVRGGSPTYPAFAKQMKVSGIVRLEVQIGADGKVTAARALSGHPVLAGAALDAARKWIYSPATLDGQTIPSTTQVDISFTSR